MASRPVQGQPVAKGLHFPIRISSIWAPLLFLLGATQKRSYAVIEDGALRVRFGFLTNDRFPLGEMSAVSRSRWPIWAGIGWRSIPFHTVGYIGSYTGIVEVRFKRRRWVWVLLPLPYRRLCISLRDPDAFVAALSERLTQG